MRPPRWLLIALGLGLAVPAPSPAAAGGPYWTVGKDGTLLVSGLPDILSRPEVRPHLTTGLTTTFVLRATAVDPAGRKVKGGGRIDIRWELWDETFLTAALGTGGRLKPAVLPSYERLTAWWRGLEIPLATGVVPGDRWQVKVEVSVVPFSRSEQRETQRWFSDSLGQVPRSGEGTGPDAEPTGGGLLDLLIVTSIKRPNLATYVWTASRRPPGT